MNISAKSPAQNSATSPGGVARPRVTSPARFCEVSPIFLDAPPLHVVMEHEIDRRGNIIGILVVVAACGWTLLFIVAWKLAHI